MPSNVPWFPLYPNLMRLVHVVVGHWLFAGLLISMVAGMVAAIVYWRWLDVAHVPRSRKWSAFMFLMLYPYGWYLFGVVHRGALPGAGRRRVPADREGPLRLGRSGRSVGHRDPSDGPGGDPGLFVHGLVHVASWSPPVAVDVGPTVRDPQCLGGGEVVAPAVAPLLSVAGVGSYAVYLWFRFGDPVAFATNQAMYHREPGLYNILKIYYFETVIDWSDALHPITMTAQAVVLVVVLASVPFVGRRFGWGYAAFVGVLGMIPVFSSEDFMGVGRYMMAAFPTMALFGYWLGAPERRSPQRTGWFAFATVILFVAVWGFSRSWYFT